MSLDPELLLSAGQIGTLNVRNRIVLAPMGTGFGGPDGVVDDRMVAHYARRARGGVGLVVVEGNSIDSPVGLAVINQLRTDNDGLIPGLARLADAIHQGGAKAAIQLNHGGMAARARMFGLEPVAPSPVEGAAMHVPDRQEIAGIVDRFVAAARRVASAGFDGIELQAAHCYLISNFLSRSTNRREDEYGGDMAGRARLLTDVIRSIKGELGAGFPLWVRINGFELGRPDGITPEESGATALLAEAAGADAVHVSAFGYDHPVMWASAPQRAGFLVPVAHQVKRAVSVPVIAVGRINPALGEQVLRENKADFIALGRALLAEPDLPHKLADGKVSEIRPCLGCLKCRDILVTTGGPLICSVNPAIGRDHLEEFPRAPRSKKVVVIGGGPAGMEAARTAALRGHEVTLFEKEDHLGNILQIGARPPEKDDIAALREYLADQLTVVGVRVEVGTVATGRTVAALSPEAVIVAAGAAPAIPEMPGVRSNNVTTAIDVLSGHVVPGQKVAIVGGELVGCETADFLAATGRQVTVLRRGHELATKMNMSPRGALLRRLRAKGVRLLTDVQYEGITSRGIAIKMPDGAREVIEADTVVLATGAVAERALLQELEGQSFEVHAAGDCVMPRGILESVAEGRSVGLAI